MTTPENFSPSFIKIKKAIDENVHELSSDEQTLLIDLLKKDLILFQRSYRDVESFFDAYRSNKNYVFNNDIYKNFIRYIDNPNSYLDEAPNFQGDVEILMTNLLLKYMKDENEFIQDSVINHGKKNISGRK